MWQWLEVKKKPAQCQLTGPSVSRVKLNPMNHLCVHVNQREKTLGWLCISGNKLIKLCFYRCFVN